MDWSCHGYELAIVVGSLHFKSYLTDGFLEKVTLFEAFAWHYCWVIYFGKKISIQVMNFLFIGLLIENVYKKCLWRLACRMCNEYFELVFLTAGNAVCLEPQRVPRDKLWFCRWHVLPLKKRFRHQTSLLPLTPSCSACYSDSSSLDGWGACHLELPRMNPALSKFVHPGHPRQITLRTQRKTSLIFFPVTNHVYF